MTCWSRYCRYDDDTDGLLSFEEFKEGFKPLVSFQMEELKLRLTEADAKQERLKLEKHMAKKSLEKESMMDRVSQHIDNSMDAVGAVATKAAEGSIGVVGAVGKGVGKGVVGVGKGAFDAGKEITGTVAKGIGSGVVGAFDAGKEITGTVAKGIGSGVVGVGKGIGTTVSKVLPLGKSEQQLANADAVENERREPERTEQILPTGSEEPEIDEVDQFLLEEDASEEQEKTQKIGVK
eukprot:COSAG02_NODE_88_length_38629_cov_457.967999_15_plen_236_part_00